MNNLIFIIFLNQFIFLIILIFLRIFFKRPSVHLINVSMIAIIFFPFYIFIESYTKSYDQISIIKIYFSNSMLFMVMLSTLERSVALAILRKVFLKKIISENMLEKQFNISRLIDKRLKNLNENNIIKLSKNKISLTKSGRIIHRIIIIAEKIF